MNYDKLMKKKRDINESVLKIKLRWEIKSQCIKIT